MDDNIKLPENEGEEIVNSTESAEVISNENTESAEVIPADDNTEVTVPTENTADSTFAKLVEQTAAAQSENENSVDTEAIKKKNKTLSVIISILLVIIAACLGIFAAAFYSAYKEQHADDVQEEKIVNYVKKASKKADFPLHIYGSAIETETETETAVASELIEICAIDQLNATIAMNEYYDSYYGEGYGQVFTGYDPSVSPAAQTTYDTDGNQIAYDEYFMNSAISEMERCIYIYNLGHNNTAIEGVTLAGDESESATEAFELDDSVIETINSYVTSCVNGSDSASVSIYEYLTGKGFSKKDAANIITQYYYLVYYADSYTTWAQEQLENAIPESEIDSYVQEHIDDYKVADVYLVSMSTSDLEDAESLIADIQENVTDFESFKELALGDTFAIAEEDFEDSCYSAATKRSTIETYVNSETAEWMFSDERKAGDTLLVDMTESGGFYVFCIATPAYYSNEKLPSIRVIPFYDEAGEKSLDDLKAECDAVVAEFEAGDKSEESFIELVQEYSCDSTTQANDGLMEDIERGTYLEAIETWAYDESRVTGDYTTIELGTNGYCILFFSKLGESAGYSDAVSALSSEKMTTLSGKWTEEYEGSLAISDEVSLEKRAEILTFVSAKLITEDTEEGTTTA